MIFYTVRIWTGQIKASNKYNLFKPVSMIAIIAFDVLSQDDDYLRHYQIISHPTDKKGESITIGRMVCINLAKFNVSIDQLQTDIER